MKNSFFSALGTYTIQWHRMGRRGLARVILTIPLLRFIASRAISCILSSRRVFCFYLKLKRRSVCHKPARPGSISAIFMAVFKRYYGDTRGQRRLNYVKSEQTNVPCFFRASFAPDRSKDGNVIT